VRTDYQPEFRLVDITLDRPIFRSLLAGRGD